MNPSIDTLFRRHQRELVNWLTPRLRCRETARDVVQESFLVLARVSAEQTVAQPRAFLYRVAQNLSLDHIRRRKVMDDYLKDAEVRLPDAAGSSECAAAADQCLEQLWKTLDAMPPLTRNVFVSVKIHGLSYRETARQFGLKERQVEHQLARVRSRCWNLSVEEDQYARHGNPAAPATASTPF